MAARPTAPILWPTTTASAISLSAHPAEEMIAGPHMRLNILTVKGSLFFIFQ